MMRAFCGASEGEGFEGALDVKGFEDASAERDLLVLPRQYRA